MTLNDVRDALLEVTDKTYHYEAAIGTKPPYLVWAEHGQGDTVWADGKRQYQAIAGTIDLFTKTENDPLFNTVQDTLSERGIPHRLESIQYEKDTKLIHYEWSWEIG